MVQATLALHLCVLLVRLQTVLSVPEVGDLMEASTVQTYYLGAYVLAVLLLSIGAVLMATDRVRTELEHGHARCAHRHPQPAGHPGMLRRRA